MNKIYEMQETFAGILSGNAYFSDLTDPMNPVPIIPIISQRRGDLSNELGSMLANIGIGVLVMLPDQINFSGQNFKVELDPFFSVVVSENPTQNTTGKPAEEVMEKIFALEHWRPNSPTINKMWNPGKFRIAANAARLLEPVPKMPSLVNWALRFQTTIAIP